MAKREIPANNDAESRREVGRGLRRVRQQLGLSQTDLAARANTTQSSVNRAEIGDPAVSQELLARIADVLLSPRRES